MRISRILRSVQQTNGHQSTSPVSLMGKATGLYAVRKGFKAGVYTTWEETSRQVNSYPGAQYAKFKTMEQCNQYLSSHDSKATAISVSASVSNLPSSVTTPSQQQHYQQKKRSYDLEQIEVGYKRAKDSKNRAKRAESPIPDVTNARVVYCDGSSLGNGKAGATAGIGVYFQVSERTFSERVPGPLQTNNRGEMYAIARTLEEDPTPHLPLTIATDSEYCINCFQTWIYGWRRNGFLNADRQPVANKDLLLYVLSLIALRMPALSSSSSLLLANVRFKKVRAHVAIYGNEEADRLAKEGALMQPIVERDYLGDTQRNERLLAEKMILRSTSDGASIPASASKALTTISKRTAESKVDKVEEFREERLKEAQKLAREIEFLIEVDEDDLLTMDELLTMELSQDFHQGYGTSGRK